jgi:hypothetical protein
MLHTDQETLEMLKFELQFLEDGGYGRSPRTPWRPSFVFTDSPTCLNFNDRSRPHPCSECALMQFVPERYRGEPVPCWTIPIGPKGQTVEDLYACGSQAELEETLKLWLRTKIREITSNCQANSEK